MQGRDEPGERLFDPQGGPLGGVPAPETGEEGLVAQGGAQPVGIVEQRVGDVHLGQWRVGAQPADLVDITSEDRRFQVGGTDEVKREAQCLVPAQPTVVAGHDRGEPLDGAGGGVVAEQLVQHRHEVTLARAEGAVHGRPHHCVGAPGCP